MFQKNICGLNKKEFNFFDGKQSLIELLIRTITVISLFNLLQKVSLNK